MIARKSTWCLLLWTLALFPWTAAAQSRSTPAVSLGAGAGIALPFHGDFDFTPWAWEADVRIAMASHALFEVALGEWRHSATFAGHNIAVVPGAGVIGRLDEKTTRTQRTLQANVLFTGTVGRLRLNAGGGLGVLQHHRQTTTVTTDCSPGLSCGSFESAFSSLTGSAQAVGGAEVRLAGGAALYGQMRFVVPFADPAGGDLRATAGVRLGFGNR